MEADERTCVIVRFDLNGAMTPLAVIDDAGMSHRVLRVDDMHPAESIKKGAPGDRYTVGIEGGTMYLYFIHSPDIYSETPGYWIIVPDTA